ncbi:MAG TPA: DsrE family protein [Nitrospirales bacterium]
MAQLPSPNVLVLIQADPLKSPRAVEALRIALGLGSHNEGHDLHIILSGRAPYLLAEDTSNVMDAEILEHHLPVFIEWGTPFQIAPDAEVPPKWLPDCTVTPATTQDIANALHAADRVLVF